MTNTHTELTYTYICMDTCVLVEEGSVAFQQMKHTPHRVWRRTTPSGTHIRMNTGIHGCSGKQGAGRGDWKGCGARCGRKGRKEDREGGKSGWEESQGHSSEEGLARLMGDCLKQSCLWEKPWISRKRVTKGTHPRSTSGCSPHNVGSARTQWWIRRDGEAISQQAG